jgi:hypothetical protein
VPDKNERSLVSSEKHHASQYHGGLFIMALHWRHATDTRTSGASWIVV